MPENQASLNLFRKEKFKEIITEEGINKFTLSL